MALGGRAPGEQSPHWKGDAVSKNAARGRAHRLYPGPLVCEREGCGLVAERHHKDGDTKNNTPSNIEFLCHKHHTEADGRARRLVEAAAAANRGRKHPPRSAEWRARLSAAMRGKPVSPETRAKLRAANLGKKVGPPSAETRARISAAKRKKVADGLS